MAATLDLRVKDQYDDNGVLLQNRLASRGVPAMLKTAADMSQAYNRSPDDYALAVSTPNGNVFKFPLVDPGNALVSAIYFAECNEYLPPGLRKEASAKISAALKSFGLPVPEELTKTATIELGFSEEADNYFLEKLFVSKDPDDPWEKIEGAFNDASPRGRLRLAMQVKTAGVDLKTMPKLASYLNTQVGPNFPAAIELRKIACGYDLDTCAKLVEISLHRDQGATAETLISELESFDKVAGMESLYGAHIPDPIMSVVADAVEKTASAHVEIDGREYDADAIMRVTERSGTVLAAHFGDQLVSSLKTDPVAVLSSLPAPHKSLIAGLMNAN